MKAHKGAMMLSLVVHTWFCDVYVRIRFAVVASSSEIKSYLLGTAARHRRTSVDVGYWPRLCENAGSRCWGATTEPKA
jgi:hypothetical protein